ncbi:T9SS type A sorting domain-containing protein [Labilibacter sediminis]|nr:T9SS type A sorting domain-containing protein [Labilibacter sediminis]
MKKLLLFVVIAIVANTLNAQVTICDFESPLANGPVIIGGSGTQTGTVVVNPEPDAVNSSANVLKTTMNAIGGNPAGNKIDAVMFQLPAGVSFKAGDYDAIKVNIYVTGGTPATILKPRGKAGIWLDDATSPAPGTWIGVVKNRVNGEDGLATDQTEGWMECYFDISGKTQTDDYNSIQIQMDWNDARPNALEIYFDDFVLVNEIPTGIESLEENAASIYYANGLVHVKSEAAVNEITVSDITGRKVKQAVGSNLEQISISDLSEGIYVVTVKGSGLVYSQKIMK